MLHFVGDGSGGDTTLASVNLDGDRTRVAQLRPEPIDTTWAIANAGRRQWRWGWGGRTPWTGWRCR